jgi:hypothetical protein
MPYHTIVFFNHRGDWVALITIFPVFRKKFLDDHLNGMGPSAGRPSQLRNGIVPDHFTHVTAKMNKIPPELAVQNDSARTHRLSMA